MVLLMAEVPPASAATKPLSTDNEVLVPSIVPAALNRIELLVTLFAKVTIVPRTFSSAPGEVYSALNVVNSVAVFKGRRPKVVS